MFNRFSAERSPDPVSLTEAEDRHYISKDPQKRVREGVSFVGTGFCWARSVFNRQMRVTMRNCVTVCCSAEFDFSVFVTISCLIETHAI